MRRGWYILPGIGTDLYAELAVSGDGGRRAFGVAGSLTGQGGFPVKIKSTDVGGVVASRNGPEAGVWVIAETTDLSTRYIKEVVTDDRGRYHSGLAQGTVTVWARGYGLADSPKVESEPGARDEHTKLHLCELVDEAESRGQAAMVKRAKLRAANIPAPLTCSDDENESTGRPSI